MGDQEAMARRSSVLQVTLLASALFACGKFGKKSEPGAASASAAASAGSAPAEQTAVCQVESRKTWTSSVNRLAGLTSTRVDGRVLVGLAVGFQPHVLVIEPSGEGKLVRLGVAADSPLAKNLPPAQGDRDLYRVSPALDDAGRVHGYGDYRDKRKSGQRRMACGALGVRDPFMLYDAKPLIDESKAPEAKEPAAGAPAPSAAPPPAAPPSAAPPPVVAAPPGAAPSTAPAAAVSAAPVPGAPIGIALRHAPLAVASAAPPPPSPPPPPAQPPAPPAVASDKKPKRELRDCRTIVDPGGKRSWGVGSELEGTPADGGRTTWKMRLTTVAAGGGAPNVIYEAKLPDSPGALYTFEAPVADRLADGSYVLAMRYRGSLMAFTLSTALRRLSGPRVFGGGYPTLPHFVPDALDFLLLTSQALDAERYELRFARIDGQRSAIPATLVKPRIESPSGSLAEPTLTRVGNQRWLAYQSGKRREAELVVVPVDAELAAVGRPYTVTTGSDPAAESAIFGLDGGRLVVVYIKHADGQLVSDVLRCEVKR